MGIVYYLLKNSFKFKIQKSHENALAMMLDSHRKILKIRPQLQSTLISCQTMKYIIYFMID
jgi:hypothetical protein